MAPEDTNLHAELEARLRCETLIADLPSKFVNLPAGEVGREIMDAERRIPCGCGARGIVGVAADFSQRIRQGVPGTDL